VSPPKAILLTAFGASTTETNS